MKKIYLLLLFTILSVNVTAQVVTPSLDGAFPVEMASAAGWRFGSALGGQTSFDIGIEGEDKTKPIRQLIAAGYKNIVFIGDALLFFPEIQVNQAYLSSMASQVYDIIDIELAHYSGTVIVNCF